MTMRDLAPETIIDQRYSILSRIGSGGMADVYCAQDLQLGRRVALKLLSRHLAEDPAVLEPLPAARSRPAPGSTTPTSSRGYDPRRIRDGHYMAMEYLGAAR